jgi:peptidoglycan/xylan/chitin deacetylase (PgdA/CDA1 family)
VSAVLPISTGPLWLRRLGAVRRSRSVILGYHGVARSRLRDDLSLLQVNPSRFRAQLELLLEAGFRFATVAQLVRLGAGGELPAGYAAITFDDGLRNNYTVALPILEEYGIAATVYVTIGFIGGVSPWIAGGENQMLLEDEVRALARSGWELGAHTMTHPDLSQMGQAECLHEIAESRVELERIGEVPVETFAYPFGRYGPAALAAAEEAGLLASVGTGGADGGSHSLARAMIGRADPLPLVVMKVLDRYEPLLGSPPMRMLRTASKQLRGRAQERQRENR